MALQERGRVLVNGERSAMWYAASVTVVVSLLTAVEATVAAMARFRALRKAQFLAL